KRAPRAAARRAIATVASTEPVARTTTLSTQGRALARQRSRQRASSRTIITRSIPLMWRWDHADRPGYAANRSLERALLSCFRRFPAGFGLRRIAHLARFALKFAGWGSITLPTYLGVRVRGPVSRPKVGQHELPDTTVD